MVDAKESTSWRIFVESLVWNYATLLVDAIGRIVTISLFTRVWSQESYGLWLTISSLMAYVIVADVGIEAYAGNRLAQQLGSGRQDLAKKTFYTALGIYSVLLAVLLAIVVPLLFVLPLEDVWKVKQTPLSTIRSLTVLVLAQAGFTFVAKTVHVALKATQRVDKAQQLQFLSKFVGLCITILILLLGGDFVTLALALLVSVVALEGLWVMQLTRVAPFLSAVDIKAFDWRYAGSFFKPSAYFSLLQLGYLLSFQGDILVIATVLGVSAVTPYVIVRTVSLLILQLVRGVTANLVPRTAALYAIGAKEQLNALASQAQRLAILVGLPLAIAFLFFGADFMTVWVGDSIEWDIRTIWMFGLMAISLTFWIPASNIPFATNNQERYCTVFFVGSAMGVTMAIPLANLLGGWGVALSLLLSDVVTNLWFVFREAARVLSLPPSTYLRSTVQRAMVPMAAAIVVAMLIAQWHIQPAVRLVLGGLATILVFLCTSYYLMWNSQERRALWRFITRFERANMVRSAQGKLTSEDRHSARNSERPEVCRKSLPPE